MKTLKTKIVDRWREQDLLTEKQNRHNNSIRFDRMAEEAIDVVDTDLSSGKVDLSWAVVIVIAIICFVVAAAVLYVTL